MVMWKPWPAALSYLPWHTLPAVQLPEALPSGYGIMPMPMVRLTIRGLIFDAQTLLDAGNSFGRAANAFRVSVPTFHHAVAAGHSAVNGVFGVANSFHHTVGIIFSSVE
jgi:hypothetical protein